MNHVAPLGPIKAIGIWKFVYYVDRYGNEYNSVKHVAFCAVMEALK